MIFAAGEWRARDDQTKAGSAGIRPSGFLLDCCTTR